MRNADQGRKIPIPKLRALNFSYYDVKHIQLHYIHYSANIPNYDVLSDLMYDVTMNRTVEYLFLKNIALYRILYKKVVFLRKTFQVGDFGSQTPMTFFRIIR